ncbi:MAG TPA: cell division protein ZapA [Novosphingobium sp.]
MSNVTLSIGGRSFTVACASGEEDHIASLGRMIDAKLHAAGAAAGQSESRILLFAALLLADELHEVKGGGPVQAVPLDDPAVTSRLEAIAAKLEKCASHLEALGSDA